MRRLMPATYSLIARLKRQLTIASVEFCSPSTLITRSKTFHIQIISTIFPTNQISCPFGKLVRHESDAREMEVGPLEAGLQEQASNHLKLRCQS